jgi:hypothetical protein
MAQGERVGHVAQVYEEPLRDLHLVREQHHPVLELLSTALVLS